MRSSRTASERLVSHPSDGNGKIDFFQFFTVGETPVADLLHALGQSDGAQQRAFGEQPHSERKHPLSGDLRRYIGIRRFAAVSRYLDPFAIGDVYEFFGRGIVDVGIPRAVLFKLIHDGVDMRFVRRIGGAAEKHGFFVERLEEQPVMPLAAASGIFFSAARRRSNTDRPSSFTEYMPNPGLPLLMAIAVSISPAHRAARDGIFSEITAQSYAVIHSHHVEHLLFPAVAVFERRVVP